MEINVPKRPIPVEVYRETGRLCAGWSFLEILTEQTIWGILGVDQTIGRLLTWRLDLRSRWQLILDEAPKKHNEADMAILRGINKRLVDVARDRNIVVHGAISAEFEGGRFIRAPTWTVFRGAGAGKNYPVSKEAVSIIYANILKLNAEIAAFNNRHGYGVTSKPSGPIEAEWPKPLE